MRELTEKKTIAQLVKILKEKSLL